MINLYSTGCPKCKILEMKLKQKNINFNEISDLEILKAKKILSVPVLEIDSKIFDFAQACKLVNNYNQKSRLEDFFENQISNDNEGKDYGYRF